MVYQGVTDEVPAVLAFLTGAPGHNSGCHRCSLWTWPSPQEVHWDSAGGVTRRDLWPQPDSPGPWGRCTRTRQAGCLRSRLQMKGRAMSRASGGAVRAKRARRLAKAATR